MTAEELRHRFRAFVIAILVMIVLSMALCHDGAIASPMEDAENTENKEDDLPPLFLELFIPWIGGSELPIFPPCICNPGSEVCVCQD